jgi:fatty-acyl-CoA synthase
MQAGFDPARIGDPLYFEDPKSQRYVPLDSSLFAAISAGSIRI